MSEHPMGHVVVVEDDYDIGFLLMHALGRYDWLKAVHIPTAEASMTEELWTLSNVVGILDLNLPEHNGVEIAQWVKDNANPDITLIAMTALSEHSPLYKQARDCGLFKYIYSKPLPITELLSIIRETLNVQ